MDLGISGRIALVHGAGGGLGRAIAIALAQESAKVAVADIHAENAAETAAQIVTAGGTAEAIGWDSPISVGSTVISARSRTNSARSIS